jgi:hypothetical protein
VFFGGNSSGKTSILPSLALLRQTIDSADRTLVLNPADTRNPLDLGSLQDLVYGHSLTAEIGYEFRWKPLPDDFPGGKIPPTSTSDSPTLGFDLRIGMDGTTSAYVVDMHYELEEHIVGMKRRTQEPEAGKYDMIDEGFDLRRKRGKPRST